MPAMAVAEGDNDDDADAGGDVALANVCKVGVEVAVAEEVEATAVVVASLNCHPLNGMPITLVAVVAVADVFSQPESPPKSLAYSKICPSETAETH